jgi:lysophospholipase L1-like esterase
MEIQKPPTIVFFGDSITEGVIGASYVNMVRKALHGQAHVVNAGINGDTVVNLRRRVGRDVAPHAPDVVVVLVGLNDMGTVRAVQLQRGYYRLVKHNWVELTPQRYATGYRALLAKLRQQTDATIMLSTLTTITEEPDSPVQEFVDAYSVIVRAIAHQEGLQLVELREAFRTAVAADPRPGEPYTIKTAVADMLAIRWQGATYERLQAQRNYRLTVDGVHLAEAGAVLAAEVMVQALQQRVADGRMMDGGTTVH